MRQNCGFMKKTLFEREKMKWNELFEKWSPNLLKVNVGFAEMEFQPNDIDKDAAWEMYVELQTRIITQDLNDESGDEKMALESVAKMFELTRLVLKKYGRHSPDFSRIALFILNDQIRPFTAKWHRLSLNGAFEDVDKCQTFRDELKRLQVAIKGYASILAEMADMDDIHINKNKS